MKGQTAVQTRVIGVSFGMDDGFVVLDVGGYGDAGATDRMFENALDEKGDIAHPRRIRSLAYGLLQDIGFSDAFQKRVKVGVVCDHAWFVQFTTATITRCVVVLVPSGCLFLSMKL